MNNPILLAVKKLTKDYFEIIDNNRDDEDIGLPCKFSLGNN